MCIISYNLSCISTYVFVIISYCVAQCALCLRSERISCFHPLLSSHSHWTLSLTVLNQLLYWQISTLFQLCVNKQSIHWAGIFPKTYNHMCTHSFRENSILRFSPKPFFQFFFFQFFLFWINALSFTLKFQKDLQTAFSASVINREAL